MSVVTIVILLIIIGLQLFESYIVGTNQKIFEAHFLRLDKKISELGASLSDRSTEAGDSH